MRACGWEPVFVFARDHGGAEYLRAYTGAEVIVAGDAYKGALKQATRGAQAVAVFDNPEPLRQVRSWFKGTLVFEVHSSLERSLLRMQPTDIDLADLVVAPSRWSVDKIRRMVGPAHPEKYRVVPNFVDRKAFRRPTRKPGEAAPGPQVFWVGKLHHDKNYADAVRVCGLVARQVPDARFTFVTGGVAARDEAIEFLNLLAMHGLEERSDWLNNLSSPELGAMYREAGQGGGVILSCSKHESFGIAVLEAMSCGVPAVIWDADALIELFPSREEALAFDQGELVSTAQAIVRLLSEPDTWRDASVLQISAAERFAGPQIIADYCAALTRSRRRAAA